jgi:hypothetical protein
MRFPVASDGVEKEKSDAMVDVQASCHEYGVPIRISLRGEGDVTRDKYKSISQRKTPSPILSFMANPVDYNPSEKQLEKAGIREPCDAIAYTAMQDWIDSELEWKDIDIVRTTAVLQGQEMEIKSKGYSGQYGSSYLYITLGLVRK